MCNDFTCQYCGRMRRGDQFAGIRRGKRQCIPCRDLAEHNLQNHDQAEQARKTRRRYL